MKISPRPIAPSLPSCLPLLALLLALPLASCSSAHAEAEGEPSSCQRSGSLDHVPQNSRDVYWTAPAARGVASTVAALPADEQKALRQAASDLVRNCPYNRSMARLPHVIWASMEDSFALLDNNDVVWTSPVIVNRLRQVRDGLQAHRELMVSLGLDPLPAPRRGDYLHGRELWTADPAAAGDRIAVLTQAGAQYRKVTPLVDAYPEDVKTLVMEANDAVQAGTASRWPMMTELDAHRVALQEIQILAEHYATSTGDEAGKPFAQLAVACAETLEVMNVLLGGYC